MQIIKINPKKPDIVKVKKTARIIKDGGVVVYPTDTCYGIGASALDDESIRKVYAIKGRHFNKPLSVIVKNLRTAKAISEIDEKQERYFKQKLPGSYTLILRKKKIIPDILTAGKGTVGIRVPGYIITALLSEEVIIPYTTTSANLSGQLPCYSIKDFLKQIKTNKIQPSLILDAGVLPKQKLSTVIDLTYPNPKVLR
jgi:L-threonylcarbamoyladenylate synthase